MTYHAEIIAVGTELLLGNIANTDAQELSQALASVGVDVLYHTVVGDNPQRLEEAITIARKRADLLIFTGGLGPTYDDLTKETVCRVLDVPLTFHPEAAADIRRNFDTIFRREMPPGTLRQAELPEGCEVFCNRVGTAPGCVFHAGDVTAVLLPGVPSECRYLTETALLPWLRRQSSGTILSHDLRIFGLSEPQVQELLGDLMDQAVNPSLAPYAKTGEVMLRLTAKGDSPAAGAGAWTAGCLPLRHRCLRLGGDSAAPAAPERQDLLGGGELHRRPYRKTHHRSAGSLLRVPGRCGILYQ